MGNVDFFLWENPWITHVHNTPWLQHQEIHNCVWEFPQLVLLSEWLLFPAHFWICPQELFCLPLPTRWQLFHPPPSTHPLLLGVLTRAEAASIYLCPKLYLLSHSQFPDTVIGQTGREKCDPFLSESQFMFTFICIDSFSNITQQYMWKIFLQFFRDSPHLLDEPKGFQLKLRNPTICRCCSYLQPLQGGLRWKYHPSLKRFSKTVMQSFPRKFQISKQEETTSDIFWYQEGMLFYPREK